MKKLNELLNFKNYQEILRFYASGLIAGAIGFIVLYFLKEYIGLWYLFASMLTDIVIYTTGFLLKKFWVFRKKDPKTFIREIILFILMSGIFFLLDASLMYFFVSFIKLHYLIAKGINACILSVISYLVNRSITFAK